MEERKFYGRAPVDGPFFVFATAEPRPPPRRQWRLHNDFPLRLFTARRSLRPFSAIFPRRETLPAAKVEAYRYFASARIDARPNGAALRRPGIHVL